MKEIPLHPFFTIITATYNAAETLPRLLQSLAEQSCQDFVWVCQDGASNDNTLKIVEQWRDKISISVESCKDTGIYDAWNKALTREGDNLGDWVLFLGADDLLASDDVLDRVKMICVEQSDDVLFVIGDLEMFDTNLLPTKKFHVDVETYFKEISYKMIPHSALFSRKKTFTKYLFDTDFKITGDFEWIQKIWKKQEQLVAAHILITKMSSGGISDSPQTEKLRHQEIYKIRLKHGNNRILFYMTHKLFLLDKKLFPFKLWLKSVFSNFTLTQKIWNVLHNIRRYFFKSL